LVNGDKIFSSQAINFESIGRNKKTRSKSMKYQQKQQYALGLMLALCSIGTRVSAQDTSPLTDTKPLTIEGSVRGFEGREGIPYSALTLQKGDWTLRMAGAKKGASVETGATTLLHGGSDLELARTLKLSQSNITGEIGFSFSDTAAQRKNLHLTARAQWEREISETVHVFVAPRMVFGNTALVGLGIGARVQMDKQSDFMAQFTPLLQGRNNTAGFTGRAVKHGLWEVGVAIKQESNSLVTLGLTNTLGPTTGFSLSPSIGGNAFVVKVRFTK
jgi:hypothetical protein